MAELLDYHYKGSQKDDVRRQASSLVLRMGKRKVAGALLTLIIMLALPVTLIAMKQQQNTKQHAAEITGFGCPIDFTDASTASLACLNRTYCITKGDGATTFNPSTTVSRQEFIAFITRYHVQVKKDWTYVDPTSTTEVADQTLFTDVPRTHALAKEIYTAKKYGWVKGDGVGFDPNGNWTFGFHGIIREGSTTNTGAASPDCYTGCYAFSTPGVTMTRQALIDQMYEFGKGNADLVTCLLTPTVAASPTSVVSTPIPSEPIVNGPAAERCTNPVTYPKSYSSTYPLLGTIMKCLNQSYCVVQGNSHVELNADNLGYTTKLTRSQYVTFITRYHTEVLKDEWKQAYDTIGDYYKLPTTKRFYDVSADQNNPNYHALWREIYTSQKMGFIVGFEDNTFKPEGLWRYGFHGITRQDSYNGSYNFSMMGNSLTRGEFLTLLYDYGMNVKKQLTACVPTPTPTHANFPTSETAVKTPTPTIRTATPTVTPTPTRAPVVTSTPTPALQSIIIYAAGSPASNLYPTMDLAINNVLVKRWDSINSTPSTKPYTAYTYTPTSPLSVGSKIQVKYINDTYVLFQERALYIDKVIINGKTYETEKDRGCGIVYNATEALLTNGQFEFCVK